MLPYHGGMQGMSSLSGAHESHKFNCLWPSRFLCDRWQWPYFSSFPIHRGHRNRNTQAYITTLLGSLQCWTDAQVAGGKAILLKYVTPFLGLDAGVWYSWSPCTVFNLEISHTSHMAFKLGHFVNGLGQTLNNWHHCWLLKFWRVTHQTPALLPSLSSPSSWFSGSTTITSA